MMNVLRWRDRGRMAGMRDFAAGGLAILNNRFEVAKNNLRTV